MKANITLNLSDEQYKELMRFEDEVGIYGCLADLNINYHSFTNESHYLEDVPVEKIEVEVMKSETIYEN